MSRTCSGSAGMMRRWSGSWTDTSRKCSGWPSPSSAIAGELWLALPSYDGRAALSTWLYTIARNTCLTAARAETYRRPAGDIRTFEPHAEPIRPENIALQSAIDRLPEVQRTILTLFYFEDRNIAEVASLLGMPEGTIKSHLHRARRALCDMLE
jgi:RNA polymerase sigma-70 factor (ECF subfamily)